MPIMHWLLYADHRVAPICRSLTRVARVLQGHRRQYLRDDAGGRQREVTSRWGRQTQHRLVTGREVRWHCTGTHIAAAKIAVKDEWVGTDLIFRLAPDAVDNEGRTRLDFEHIGLVPAFECYDLCSNGWQYFLGSLQQLVETGRGTLLAVVESGFDKVPPHRRLEAFRMNTRGWEAQLHSIARYVSAS